MTAHDPSPDSHTPRPLGLVSGLVLLLQGFSLFAPMAVLGGAIQWPDSLDYAPAQMLPLLREQLDAVRLGYGLYLGCSLLFLVTGVLTVRLAARPGALGALAFIAIGAAAASALARAIGILRERQLAAWAGLSGLVVGLLVAMPALDLFGIAPPISIVLSTTAIQLWFMALGLLFLWRALRRSA